MVKILNFVLRVMTFANKGFLAEIKIYIKLMEDKSIKFYGTESEREWALEKLNWTAFAHLVVSLSS